MIELIFEKYSRFAGTIYLLIGIVSLVLLFISPIEMIFPIMIIVCMLDINAVIIPVIVCYEKKIKDLENRIDKLEYDE